MYMILELSVLLPAPDKLHRVQIFLRTSTGAQRACPRIVLLLSLPRQMLRRLCHRFHFCFSEMLLRNLKTRKR